MDKFACKNQTAVVTGGAQGLGLVFCHALAEAGANIAILDLGSPGQALDELSTKYGVKANFYKTDVTSREQVTKTIEQIEKDFGSVDINVNAAGIARDESFLTSSDANVESTFKVNFNGSFLVAQACAHAMIRKRERLGPPAVGDESTTGSIVFIGSVATHVGTSAQNISIYAASKCAIRGLVKPIAMELAPYGIRVNSLSPGPMKTAMYEKASQDNPSFAYQMDRETMFKRVGIPDELKGCIIFLCSRASSWYTGQDMLVDGGASSWKHPAK